MRLNWGIILFDDNVRLHVARMIMLGQCFQNNNAPSRVPRITMSSQVFPEWQCSTICYQDDKALHVLPELRCSATCCQDDNVLPRVVRKTCLATYCLHDNVRPHGAGMTLQKHTVFSFDTLLHPPYSPDCLITDHRPTKILSKKEIETEFKDF